MVSKTFSPHFPHYIKAKKSSSVVFHTLEDLLNIDHVSKFKISKFQEKPFFRFSLSKETDKKYILMAEYDNGKSWWVVGFINQNIEDLPTWNPLEIT